VDPVPDPLTLRKSGSAGIEPGTSGSVARNSDHETTEAVDVDHNEIYFDVMEVWLRLKWLRTVI
jgi:hypothetical protein